jgi:hypothetical protein
VQLDLGSVRELAKVVVNGHQPQMLDWSPYVVDVTDQLRPGENTVAVTVTNTQTNAIEGRANPSGLLGPVSLRPQRVVDVALTADAEVTSYTLSLSPGTAAVRPGGTTTVTATVQGVAPDQLSGTLTATAPEGFTVDPAETEVSRDSSGRQVSAEVPIEVTAPADAANGERTLRVSFTGADGGERVATATLRVSPALAAWEFETDGDAEGWVAANQVTPLTVSGGALRFSSTGGDPFVTGPQVSLGAAPLTVEVVMTSSVAGSGQLFWATTAGGYSEGRSGRMAVEAGTRTYRVEIPAGDGGLRQLRLDPASGSGDFAVDAVRVLPSS